MSNPIRSDFRDSSEGLDRVVQFPVSGFTILATVWPVVSHLENFSSIAVPALSVSYQIAGVPHSFARATHALH